jgi:glycosyltransferase involved in cell wall biosynthesis
MQLSVVIPVYNEKENIYRLHKRITDVLSSIEDEYEILFVDDGSNDGTVVQLEQLCRKNDEVRAIYFTRNYGQTSALAAGIQHASGEFIATLDGDLQNDPEDILPMLQVLKEQNLDIVSGWRKDRKDKFLRSALSRAANQILSSITGLALHDYGCSMKLYRVATLKNISLYGEMHRFLPIYAHLKGATVGEYVVHHHPREFGDSKYGFQRILRVLVDIFLFYFLFHSKRPLPVFANFFYIWEVLAILFFFSYFLFASPLCLFASSVSFSAGFVFLLAGLILELIIRTHYLSQHEAQYTIKKTTNLPEQK